jgi:hypothetical protein
VMINGTLSSRYIFFLNWFKPAHTQVSRFRTILLLSFTITKPTHNKSLQINSTFCFPLLRTVKSINLSLLLDEQEMVFQIHAKLIQAGAHNNTLLPVLPNQVKSSLLLHEMNKTRSSKYIRNVIQSAHDNTFPTFSI